MSATATFDGAHIEVTELRAEAQDLPPRQRHVAVGRWRTRQRDHRARPARGCRPPGLGVAGTGRASV